MSTEIRSHRVVIQSPMSFVGSFYRTKRLADDHEGLDRAARILLVAIILVVWWAAVIGWYSIFGLLLVPYRIIRRGARKRKLADMRHQEMMSQMAAAAAAPAIQAQPGTDIAQA